MVRDVDGNIFLVFTLRQSVGHNTNMEDIFLVHYFC